MRTTVCVAAAFAALLSVLPAKAVETAEAKFDLGKNAALIYWQAFSRMSDMTKEQWKAYDKIISPPKPGETAEYTPEELKGLLAIWKDPLDLMREAAAIPDCNWGVDYATKGFSAELHHLAKCRTLARAGAFRGKYYFQKGQEKAAIQDIRATILLGRHAGNEGRDTAIGMLVQIAIEGIAIRSVAETLTDKHAAEVWAQGLGDLLNGSPEPIAKNALIGDKVGGIKWLRKNVAADPEWLRKFIAETGGDEGTKALAAMPQNQALRSIDEAERHYDEMTEINGLPFEEFNAEFAELEKKVNESGNRLSKSLVESLSNIRKEEQKYRVWWAQVRTAIEYRLHGIEGMQSVKDPCNGKPFLFKDLGDGAFELTSDFLLRGRKNAMVFGKPWTLKK